MSRQPILERPIVCMSFDDGRSDNWRIAMPILRHFDLKATFNIITDRVGTEGFMTQEQLEDLFENGFELAGHGQDHTNTRESILGSVADLRKWDLVPDDGGIGFASPNSRLTPSQCHSMADWFRTNEIAYARTGSNEGFVGVSLRIRRKLLSLIDLDGGVLLHPDNNNHLPLVKRYGLTSQVVVRNTRVEHLKRIVGDSFGTPTLIVLMFHSILPLHEVRQRRDLYAWHDKKFDALCGWLAESQRSGQIWVRTTLEAVQQSEYGKW